jgi:L-aminopeptidase/D-esterase-like protein
MNLVDKVHAVLLAGGSAFGLDAASGVMRYLEEKGIGFMTGAGLVPIVPAAVLFDLAIGSSKIRPGAEQGYSACQCAVSVSVEEGCVGAGTGAMVGQLLGNGRATKSGLGTASEILPNGVIVGAIVAVNALGDVVDEKTGEILAGLRSPDGRGLQPTIDLLRQAGGGHMESACHTTIGVVATNAKLDKSGANKMAQMAHDGLARTIHPCHTMFDGDTVFALSLGDKAFDLTSLGAIAVEVLAKAVVRAVTQATGLCGVPARRDIVLK